MSLTSLSAVAVATATSFFENDGQKCCYYQFFAKKASTFSLFIFHRRQEQELARHFLWKARSSSLYLRRTMKKVNIRRCKSSTGLISKCVGFHFGQSRNDEVWSHRSFIMCHSRLEIPWLLHIHQRLNAHFHYQFDFILIIRASVLK